MRTIIAGSRGVKSVRIITAALAHCGWTPTVVISGACPDSPDILGELWAERHNVLVERYPADWARFGRRAGMLRNSHMAYVGEALVAIWDGKSPGTKQMIEAAHRRRLRVFVWHYRKPPFGKNNKGRR